ncbi:MAG: hypothetical protein JWQ42_743 [Edaphobacter sp.]|nr:hypothetical protein [Edaphobacter sp.]MCU1318549.1 hypothetical protein [Edaphobacter sp.]
MQWTYTIAAEPRARILTRVVQLFDQQMLSLRSLVLEETDAAVHLAITVEAEPHLAQRIQAKLYKQFGISSVDLAALPTSLPPESRTNPESSVAAPAAAPAQALEPCRIQP